MVEANEYPKTVREYFEDSYKVSLDLKLETNHFR